MKLSNIFLLSQGTERKNFILFAMKMSTLKVFAVTLIEMIRYSENASSKSVVTKECHFDRRIRFVSPTHVFVSGLSSKLSGEHC